MAKGYWLSTGSIKDGEGMQPYLKALSGWFPSVNGKFLLEIWQLLRRKVLLDI